MATNPTDEHRQRVYVPAYQLTGVIENQHPSFKPGCQQCYYVRFDNGCGVWVDDCEVVFEQEHKQP